MGQKDSVEKLLVDYNDVFADVINVLLFHGERVLKPEELQESKILSQYKADDSKLHEQERDVAKYWRNENVTFALMGIENQSNVEEEMPLRIISYDGAAYRSQLLNPETKERYPVVSIVLYFGKSHWNKPKSLKEVIHIPPHLEEYVNDYRIHVFEISWLTEEQIELFQSDFKAVAEFFVQIRTDNTYKPTEIELKHVDEVLKLLAVFGDAEDFRELVDSGKSKEVGTMCEAIEKMKRESREQGIEQGILVSLKTLMETMNVSAEEACNILKVPVEKYYAMSKRIRLEEL